MRRLPILSVLSLLGLAALSAPVAAQEPSASQIAAARELVTVVGASGSIERILPALVDQIRRQAVTRPELGKDLEEVLKGLQPEIEQQRQQAYFIAARTYAKFMSEQEIRDAVVFFKTPSGAKYIQVLPELTDNLVNSITSWSELVGEYLQTRVRAEMMKRGHQLQ